MSKTTTMITAEGAVKVQATAIQPTSVQVEDGDTCQNVLDKIRAENVERYGVAAEIYAKTDYDLSVSMEDDVQRLTLATEMITDIISSNTNDDALKKDMAKQACLTKTGFKDFIDREFDDNRVPNVKQCRKALDDVANNMLVFIGVANNLQLLGTKGGAVLRQNTIKLRDRVRKGLDKVEMVIVQHAN